MATRRNEKEGIVNMSYKYSVGQKVMGRHIGHGTITFIAGEIVEQFEGLGKSYLLKLEPGITVPESLRGDGYLSTSELNAIPFDEQKWAKMKPLIANRDKAIREEEKYYNQIMDIFVG